MNELLLTVIKLIGTASIMLCERISKFSKFTKKIQINTKHEKKCETKKQQNELLKN